jgi:hypothetical protein
MSKRGHVFRIGEKAMRERQYNMKEEYWTKP